MKIIITAHPNSRHPRIEKDLFGNVHVYVSEPPLEGKANKAVREALAKYYKIAQSKVQLVKGEKSKLKTFEIGA